MGENKDLKRYLGEKDATIIKLQAELQLLREYLPPLVEPILVTVPSKKQE